MEKLHFIRKGKKGGGVISNILKCPLVAQDLLKDWELLLLFITFTICYKWNAE